MPELDQEFFNRFREEISEIDDQILQLLNKRGTVSCMIALYKSKNNLPIYDPIRENAVIERLRENSEFDALVESVWPVIMLFCKKLQADTLNDAALFE